MNLSSLSFILFLAVSAAVYWLAPQNRRNVVLLLESCAFYIWSARLLAALLLLETVFSFFFAFLIERAAQGKKRKLRLATAVTLLVLLLVIFKYFGFLAGAVIELAALCGAVLPELSLGIAVPLGISFFTLQLTGYLIDVYREKLPAERDFVCFALFALFFPQLVSGPIGRADELLPQYKQPKSWSRDDTVSGLRRFLAGAFKKLVLAGGLGVITDGVYKNLAEADSSAVLTAIVCYALVLYFDFSGYTDMAIGAALVLGIRLRENFLAPYLSCGFIGFWRRWHISLSEWFRDYLYFPLGGSRRSETRTALNIMIVFLVSGLWHGASWTFVIWGALQGLFNLADRLLQKRGMPSRPASPWGRALRRTAVFSLWALSLVFFRLTSIPDALLAFSRLFSGFSATGFIGALGYSGAGGTQTLLSYVRFWLPITAGLLLALASDVKLERSADAGDTLSRDRFQTLKMPLRWALYWFLGLSAAYFWLAANSGAVASAFIYAGF